MSNRWGTNHFVTREAANRYYEPYEGSQTAARQAVDRKVTAQEIRIGEPLLKAGQRLELNQQEGRYFIVEE